MAVYCSQSNASPTTKIEDCTTGPGNPALSVAVGDPLTSDPIVPASATAQTNGLVAPDGIVSVVPSYPSNGPVPAGATYVMYTEKLLNYYIAGVSTAGKTKFSAATTINFFPSTSTPQVLPATGSFTIEVGDLTLASLTPAQDVFVPVTCTGWSTGGATVSGQPTDNLTGCSAPAQYANDQMDKNAWLGAPGGAFVSGTTLAETGEGSTTNAQKLFKNNEDLTVLRVAYTTDGINFSSSGLTNNGIISGASNGASNYQDINNPTSDTSPANLNAYGAAGTQDATEMRFVGSAGSIIVNPDGSYGLFLSGAWAADGDSDAFNQIFYSSSTDGEHWSTPVSVVSTDYTFSASAAQDAALAQGKDAPLGISAYYSGRAYGPSVVQNPDGTLTMVFAGYRSPKPIINAGTVMGTNAAAPWTVGATDPALYRNILSVTLTSSTTPAVTTSTSVTASPTTAEVGQPETLTATVSVPSPGTGTPTGSVTFTGNAGTLCSANLNEASPDTASCQTTYGAATADSITATYSGDSNYAGSQGMTSLVVQTVPTTTTVTSSLNPSTFGQPVTFTATVSPTDGGGTVSFFADGSATAINGCSAETLAASGGTFVATCSPSLSGGPQSISATYSGDTTYGASSGSLAGGQVVTAAMTTTTLTSSLATVVYGESVTFTATVATVGPGVGTPVGNVSFTDGTTSLGTVALNGGTASISSSALSAANHTITATYAGNQDFAGSSEGISYVVGQASTSSALSANPIATAVVGQTVTFTSTVSAVAPGAGTPTGSVTFRDGATTLGSSQVNPSGVATFATSSLLNGSHTITASYSGDPNFSTSSASITYVVRGLTSTSLTSSANPSVFSHPVTLTATISVIAPAVGTPTGQVTFSDGGTPIGTGTVSADKATVTTASLAPGTHVITATYSGDADFVGSTSSVLDQVVAKSPSVLKGSPQIQILPLEVHLPTVTAFLSTPAGVALPGQTVIFSAGPVLLCTAMTNSAGIATCVPPLLDEVAIVLNLGVNETYLGNADYLGTTSRTALLALSYGSAPRGEYLWAIRLGLVGNSRTTRWPSPTTTESAGTSWRTTVPAPTTERSPIRTPLRTTTSVPIHTPSPMVTADDLPGSPRRRASGSSGWKSLSEIVHWPRMQCAPTAMRSVHTSTAPLR